MWEMGFVARLDGGICELGCNIALEGDIGIHLSWSGLRTIGFAGAKFLGTFFVLLFGLLGEDGSEVVKVMITRTGEFWRRGVKIAPLHCSKTGVEKWRMPLHAA